MHHDVEPQELLNVTAQLQSHFAGAAARTPGHIAEQGLHARHALHSLVQVLRALLGLGREVLKGEKHAILRLALADLVNDLWDVAQVGICARASAESGATAAIPRRGGPS